MSAIEGKPLRVTSTDLHTQLRMVVWEPNTNVRGVVQLVHGMAEHIMRYDRFAQFLAEKGYLVVGHDHVGHGQSVDSPDDWGCLPVEHGKEILVGDVGRVRRKTLQIASVQHPYFLFGHSMGSFVVRSYISTCGEGLEGAIICGTGHVPPAASRAGNVLARRIAKRHGERYVSKRLNDLSIGAYAKAVPNARTQLDWLSYNEQNVDDYIADPQCGFAFSAGGNATLTALTGEVCTSACCKRMPPQLPLLYIAGDGDPVGDMGKGVRKAVQMALNAGSQDVTCTIYEHMRHEILNEDDSQRVFNDIATWMEAHA
ncbi:MAG: alpha/beta hydrolase [Coriobacteriales bacterium]|nr:alpha/beta hydrolase [Coriobacteriales bacterium]